MVFFAIFMQLGHLVTLTHCFGINTPQIFCINCLQLSLLFNYERPKIRIFLGIWQSNFRFIDLY